MTDDSGGYAPPTQVLPPPGQPPRPPLRRTKDGRSVGGVAGGIASWVGIDPVLVRVAFVILTVFGGSGLLLYGIGWLFIPEQGKDQSIGQHALGDNQVLTWVVAIVGGLIVLGLLKDAWWFGPGLSGGGRGLILLLLVMAGVVWLTRHGTTQRPPPTTLPLQPPAQPLAPAPAPAPPRERSVLGRLTMSVLAIVVGVLAALGISNVVDVTLSMVLAAAVGVVGIGLIVGALVGRARWLIALGIFLVIVLLPVSAVQRSPYSFDENGQRAYRPTSVAELQEPIKLGTGDLTVDLTALPPDSATHDVTVRLAAGNLKIYLPEDSNVDADLRVGLGTIGLPHGAEYSGFGVTRTYSQTSAEAGGYQLDVQVGLGKVQVIVP